MAESNITVKLDIESVSKIQFLDKTCKHNMMQIGFLACNLKHIEIGVDGACASKEIKEEININQPLCPNCEVGHGNSFSDTPCGDHQELKAWSMECNTCSHIVNGCHSENDAIEEFKKAKS